MTAPDLSADEKAEVARFGIHDGGAGLPRVRVERARSTGDRDAVFPDRVSQSEPARGVHKSEDGRRNDRDEHDVEQQQDHVSHAGHPASPEGQP